MAKKTGARFKRSRRLGINYTGHPKAMKRMQRGMARDDGKLSEYGKQLLEKQRLAAYFGVLEKQMRNYMRKAKRSAGDRKVADVLVTMLASRLDHIVFRAGYAPTLAMARQMVNHGHFEVDGQKVDIPSFQVKPGQSIRLAERARKENFKQIYQDFYPRGYNFLEKSEDYQVKLVTEPHPEDLQLNLDLQLVVEFYSKSL